MAQECYLVFHDDNEVMLTQLFSKYISYSDMRILSAYVRADLFKGILSLLVPCLKKKKNIYSLCET